MKENTKSCPITPLPKQIGNYKIIKKIAAGGMGEVFLAQDPLCKRNVALKKIRSDLMDRPGFKERFLKEVRIAAQISHPSIIPIYQIHQTDQEIYYTMPLAEGETLKEILRKTLYQEKQGISTHPIGSSIPALMRIFLTICQAIAYSHSKGVLHRDLKPENIIIGKYGEVFILDWGLADFVDECTKEESSSENSSDLECSNLTRPGKLAGTLSYLPPERILGVKASYASDIYALGVILYQLLTLRFPFYCKNVKEYRKHMKYDTLIDPAERNPYRDIPPQLSKIAKKCLSPVLDKRYKNVEEILKDLNNYIEGHAEWSPCATIQIDHKQDWEFQENILVAKHIAITQKSDVMEWVNLMMAKQSFQGNIKFETHVLVKKSGKGIGFLFNLRSLEEKKDLFHEGFFLWIGSEKHPGCFLFKSNVEIMSNPTLHLKEHFSHSIKIEKTDNHLKFYINNILVFNYLSHIPISTPHFGVILKDEELEVGSILVSSSSPNIMVNCLAVPDAFLALRQFKQALTEYRQIAKSFSGRAEGREAIFRAGITLLEEAQTKKNQDEKSQLFQQALDEFGLLRNTPGAPLEYLGKSLVYKATNEIEEEIKCLELSLRKFQKHPLINLIRDQILFRLHEASYKERKATYHLALLTLRFIPNAFQSTDNQNLLQNLKQNCEPLPFFFLEETSIHLQLAFYLCKPLALKDFLNSSASVLEKIQALFCLLYLGHPGTIPEILKLCKEDPENENAISCLALFYKTDLLTSLEKYFSVKKSHLSSITKSTLTFLLDQFLFTKPSLQSAILKKLKQLCQWDLPLKQALFIKEKTIESFLCLRREKEAEYYLSLIPKELIEEESSPFYFLNACLMGLKGDIEEAQKKLHRFSERFLPPTFCLIDSFFLRDADWEKKWTKEAFFWEKFCLLKQLFLFYTSIGLGKEALIIQKKIDQEVYLNRELQY